MFVYVWLLGMNNEGSRVALRKRGHLRGAHALPLPSQTAPHATWQRATERDGSVGSKQFFPPDVPARRLPLSLIQSDTAACPPPSSPQGGLDLATTANRKVGREGRSHALTHRQLCTACWDFISLRCGGPIASLTAPARAASRLLINTGGRFVFLASR